MACPTKNSAHLSSGAIPIFMQYTRFHIFDLGLWDGAELCSYEKVFKQLNIPPSNYRIDGFEAYPPFATHCTNRFSHNPSIHIHNIAISDRTTTVKLYKNGVYGGPGNSLFPDKNNVDSNDFVCIEAISLFEYIEANFPFSSQDDVFRILKLNIEGAEHLFYRDLLRRGYYDYFNLYIGADPGCDLLKVESLVPKYFKLLDLLKLSNIHTHHFCMDTPRQRRLSVDLKTLILSKTS